MDPKYVSRPLESIGIVEFLSIFHFGIWKILKISRLPRVHSLNEVITKWFIRESTRLLICNNIASYTKPLGPTVREIWPRNEDTSGTEVDRKKIPTNEHESWKVLPESVIKKFSKIRSKANFPKNVQKIFSQIYKSRVRFSTSWVVWYNRILIDFSDFFQLDLENFARIPPSKSTQPKWKEIVTLSNGIRCVFLKRTTMSQTPNL